MKNDLGQIGGRTLRLAVLNHPMFSIVLNCEDASHQEVDNCLKKLSTQDYSNFEIILLGIKPDYAIKVQPEPCRGCVAATNYRGSTLFTSDGLSLLRGDFFLSLNPEDVLSKSAFSVMSETISNNEKRLPDVVIFDFKDLLFGKTHYMPGWDPDLVAYNDYTPSATCLRTEWVRSLVAQTDVSTKTECLRAAALMNCNVLHIPITLATLARDASLETRPFLVASERCPKFSVIIPNRNGLNLLPRCVEFLENIGSSAELIIVDNRSDDPAVGTMYEQLKERFGAQIVFFDRSFNYSAMVNKGVGVAQNDLVLLLNNDVFISDVSSVITAIKYAERTGVGVVGSVLRYPDNRVQHAGIVLSYPSEGDCDTSHVLRFSDGEEFQHVGALTAPRNWQCVTGAFQVVRKSLFESLGGYDEVNLPIEFNDIDFCLRVRAQGLRVVCLPLVGIFHDESYSRSKADRVEADKLVEDAYGVICARWYPEYRNDPFYNRQLQQKQAGRVDTSGRLGSWFSGLIKRRVRNHFGSEKNRASINLARARMKPRLRAGLAIVAPFLDNGLPGQISRALAMACDAAQIDVSFVNSLYTTASVHLYPVVFQAFPDRVVTVYVGSLSTVVKHRYLLGEGRLRVLCLIGLGCAVSEQIVECLKVFDQIWVVNESDAAELGKITSSPIRLLPPSLAGGLYNARQRQGRGGESYEEASRDALASWLQSTVADLVTCEFDRQVSRQH